MWNTVPSFETVIPTRTPVGVEGSAVYRRDGVVDVHNTDVAHSVPNEPLSS
jgi:hypothetical protein